MPRVSLQGLFFAGALLCASAALAAWLRLGLGRSLVAAGARSVLQLSILGVLLGWIFRSRSPAILALAIVAMTAIAARTAVRRVPFRHEGMVLHAFIALVFASWVLTLFALTALLPEGAWREPAIVLPFVGILLGNSLSGISLGAAQWVKSLHQNRERVEFWLSHGASRWEAARVEFRESLKTAMTPVLNSMSVAGLVSLPGMMTGQLLAGASPESAVRYQIATMLLVGTGTLVGTLIALGFGFFTLFNGRHQFQSELLAAPAAWNGGAR